MVTSQERWGQAIIDLKEQFPDLSASERADWLNKYANLSASGSDDNAERKAESNQDKQRD